jgi:hypothetical protein
MSELEKLGLLAAILPVAFIVAGAFLSTIVELPSVIGGAMLPPRPKPKQRDDNELCRLKREAKTRGEHIAP